MDPAEVKTVVNVQGTCSLLDATQMGAGTFTPRDGQSLPCGSCHTAGSGPDGTIWVGLMSVCTT